MSKPTDKMPMEKQLTDDPIESEGGNPSQRSRLRAATGIQSSVKPGDYPKAERDAQVTAATGRVRKDDAKR